MSKILKIVIAVVVLAAIGAGAYFYCNKPVATPAEPAVVEEIAPTVDETSDPTANG